MNAGWWQEDEIPRSSGLLSRLSSAPPPTPPATLLHVPAPFRLAAPQRQAAPADLPAKNFPDAGDGFILDTPGTQHGLVKLWRAQAVDLRRLLFPPPPGHSRPGERRRRHG